MQTLREAIIDIIVQETGLNEENIDMDADLLAFNISPLFLLEITSLICNEFDIDFTLIDISKFKVYSVNNLAQALEPYIGLIF